MEAAQQQANAQANILPDMNKLAIDERSNGDHLPNGGPQSTEEDTIIHHHHQPSQLLDNDDHKMALGTVLAADPIELTNSVNIHERDTMANGEGGFAEEGPNDGELIHERDYTEGAETDRGNTEGAPTEGAHSVRPSLRDRLSQSYTQGPIPIVTTYDDEEEMPNERPSARPKSVKSVTPSTKPAAPTAAKAPSTKAPSIKSVKSTKSAKAPSTKAGTINQHYRESTNHSRLPTMEEGAVAGGLGGLAVGEVASHERQRELQQHQQHPSMASRGHSLQDQGVIPRDRSTQFEQQQPPHRAQSPYGARPEPQLIGVMSGSQGGRESRMDGRDGILNRNGTVISRAGTLGRNGTLSRGANGGTVGSRRGAFGRGAGTSVGTQPEEVLGRDDIHARAELSERILDDVTLRRLAGMEKKDAYRLSKVIKSEGKAEAKAVAGSIKELERLVKLQREAAAAERKSQLRLSKWTSKEHKARLRFLKEKERYEKVEGELRNAENDYEERRDHAGGITAQVAEKTQELDDLRAQKAADDREREVKLLALKNPAHS